MTSTPISVLAEDQLCESLAIRLLEMTGKEFSGISYLGHGYGYIKTRLAGFNSAAAGIPLLVLTDLVGDCAKTQVEDWLPHGHHPNLVFRIAVRESESWVLADSEGIAGFLGVSKRSIPADVDAIEDPKRFLIDLARTSRKRSLREALVPKPGVTSVIGPDYNGRLAAFVRRFWDPHKALARSPSLNRGVVALRNYSPALE